MFRNIFAVVLTVFALTGCKTFFLKNPSDKVVEQQSGNQGNFKIGNPYQAGGKWYTPRESYSYDETGIASWYGDEFHGKRTANGEVFDKEALTAAHPTLQLPALIRVTNLSNGRSAVLRVNDRGPFSKSRLIDVSHGSAKVLGFDGAGTARVRVQVLEHESQVLAEAARKGYPPYIQMAMAFRRNPVAETTTTEQTVQVASADTANVPAVEKVETTTVETTDLAPPTNVTKSDIADLNKQLFKKFPVSPTSIYIQAGAFASVENANTLRGQLSKFGNAAIYPTTVNGKSLTRVRIGPLQSVESADALLKKVLVAGFPSARIVVD